MGAGRLLPWIVVGIRSNWQLAEAEEPRPSGTLLRGLELRRRRGPAALGTNGPIPRSRMGILNGQRQPPGTGFPRSLRRWTRGSPKGGGDSDIAGRGAEVPGEAGESTQSEVR